MQIFSCFGEDSTQTNKNRFGNRFGKNDFSLFFCAPPGPGRSGKIVDDESSISGRTSTTWHHDRKVEGMDKNFSLVVMLMIEFIYRLLTKFQHLGR